MRLEYGASGKFLPFKWRALSGHGRRVLGIAFAPVASDPISSFPTPHALVVLIAKTHIRKEKEDATREAL